MERRTFVRLVCGTGVAAALAGCSGAGQSEDPAESSADDHTHEDDGDHTHEDDGDHTHEDGSDGSDTETHDPDLMAGEVALHNPNPVEITDGETGDLLAQLHWHGSTGHWHRGPVEVSMSEPTVGSLRFVTTEGDILPLGGEYTVRAEPTEESPENVVHVSVNGQTLQFDGQQEGETAFLLRLFRDGDEVYVPPSLPVTVV